jgi:hypothetical protein
MRSADSISQKRRRAMWFAFDFSCPIRYEMLKVRSIFDLAARTDPLA